MAVSRKRVTRVSPNQAQHTLFGWWWVKLNKHTTNRRTTTLSCRRCCAAVRHPCSCFYHVHSRILPHLHGPEGRLVGLLVVSSRHPYEVDGFRVLRLPPRKTAYGFPLVLVSIVPIAWGGGRKGPKKSRRRQRSVAVSNKVRVRCKRDDIRIFVNTSRTHTHRTHPRSGARNCRSYEYVRLVPAAK